MSYCKVISWTFDVLIFVWMGKYSLEYVSHLVMWGKEKRRYCKTNLPAGLPLFIQCDLAGGSNSSFLGKPQVTELESTLILGTSWSFFYLHCCLVMFHIFMWWFAAVVGGVGQLHKVNCCNLILRQHVYTKSYMLHVIESGIITCLIPGDLITDVIWEAE